MRVLISLMVWMTFFSGIACRIQQLQAGRPGCDRCGQCDARCASGYPGCCCDDYGLLDATEELLCRIDARARCNLSRCAGDVRQLRDKLDHWLGIGVRSDSRSHCQGCDTGCDTCDMGMPGHHPRQVFGWPRSRSGSVTGNSTGRGPSNQAAPGHTSLGNQVRGHAVPGTVAPKSSKPTLFRQQRSASSEQLGASQLRHDPPPPPPPLPLRSESGSSAGLADDSVDVGDGPDAPVGDHNDAGRRRPARVYRNGIPLPPQQPGTGSEGSDQPAPVPTEPPPLPDERVNPFLDDSAAGAGQSQASLGSFAVHSSSRRMARAAGGSGLPQRGNVITAAAQSSYRALPLPATAARPLSSSR